MMNKLRAGEIDIKATAHPSAGPMLATLPLEPHKQSGIGRRRRHRGVAKLHHPALNQDPHPLRVRMGMNALECFSDSYGQARRKFLTAAVDAGGQVQAFRHPELGADGEELSADVAWLGPRDARCVVVMISATHGIEASRGSWRTNQLAGAG